MNKMELCWTYCDHCGEKIKVGDKCFYLANGDTFCTECVVLVDTSEEYKKRFDDCERAKMENKELKPCPFCGGDEAYLTRNCYGQNYVRCPNCGAVVWGKDDETPSEKEIVKIWNRRAKDGT